MKLNFIILILQMGPLIKKFFQFYLMELLTYILKDLIQQEILMNLADMLIEGYMAESVLLRAEKLVGMRGEEACQIEIDMARVFLHHAVDTVVKAGREAIYAFADGDEERLMLMGLKRFTKIEPFNLKEARRRIADHIISKNEYPF